MTATIHIRPFAPPDEPAVIALWRACNLVFPQNDPAKDIQRKLHNSPDLFLIAEHAGQIVGAVMAGYEGHRGWINYLAVSPAHRREGIGRHLMAAAEQKLRDLGCPKINLQVRKTNTDVIAFYQSIGFLEDNVLSLGKRLIHDQPKVSPMSDVIYFDNAATSWPKPAAVAQRMSDFLATEAANPGRAGHRMAVGAEKMLDKVRKQFTDFICGTGKGDHHRLVFTMNGTDALNIALKGLLRQGDHVITTTLEHNSVSRPLQAMADSGFITLTRINFSPDTGTVDPADFDKAITPQTRLIAMTHGSNVLGTIQPIEAIGKIAKAKNVRFLVDSAQTIGTVPINIEQQHIDVLAFPGHKSLLGPTGTGGLYLHTTLSLDDIHAFREGGTGGDSSSPTQPKLFPYFLEGGTPNTVGIAGLGAALEYVVAHDPAKTLAKEQAMVQKIIDLLLSNPKFHLYGPKNAAIRVGTLSFTLDGYTPQEAGSILDESFNIAIRPGLHCSPYAHKTLGTFPDGAIRISPGHFNTDAELTALLDALSQLAA